MKVVILNAGIGTRLKPLTNRKPKCLIKISEKETILDYQLKQIIKCNLSDIIILTGPFEEKIEEHIKNNYPELKVQYIKNPKYDKTNYIYTVYLTKGVITEDIILFHGDLIFSEMLLKDILNSKFPNCVLVNKEIPPPKKDFKALIINKKIERIGVDIFDSNAFFLAPLYKLKSDFFNKWLNQIEKFIQINKVNCYAEDALNEILKELNLRPLYFNESNCMEIDNFEDLNRIRFLLKQK